MKSVVYLIQANEIISKRQFLNNLLFEFILLLLLQPTIRSISQFRSKCKHFFLKRREKMYKKFEELLLEKGVTAYRVSKETDIAQSTLSDWKNGRSTPKADKLKIIAEYFGKTVDYFLS
jgi:hypothetical protein